MAQFSMDGVDDLIRQLDRLGDLDRIAPKMIEESLPILEDSLKGVVAEEVMHGYATGDMVQSIKKTKSLRNQYGYFGAVRPTGKDRKGVRNMEKLAYLHYGTSRQPARPVMEKAVFKVEEKVLAKMQEVYNREVEG